MKIQEVIQRARFTVLLGKNGAGKSSLLRGVDGTDNLNTRYITPERGGTLKYEPGIDNNIASSPTWLTETRRQNRLENFRQQSAAQFRNLEIMFLRELERDAEKRKNLDHNFDTIISQLNEFLPAIRLRRSDRGFTITDRSDQPITETSISSGESEFISQAIELLVFARMDLPEKVLLLDEPDVHLHPDLQSRFVGLIERIALDHEMRVVIATHSTAILSGFSDKADLQIVPVVNRNQEVFEPFVRSKVADELLPIFGAHPLSSLFNRSPILLVEGEDDRRVIDQLIRSSQGRIRYSPSVVGSVSEMGKWEIWLDKFLPVLYDDPQAYSLRDLDNAKDQQIDDLRVVKRARLNCYAIENLLLTDECLAAAGSNSSMLLDGLQKWKETYKEHPQSADVAALVENFESRRTLKIKATRNIVMAVIGVSKPWEVHIGQVLADRAWQANSGSNTIAGYLGEKARQLFIG